MPPKIHGLVVDGAILSGLGLVSYGSWLLSHPAGFIVSGALMLVLGLAGAVRK